MKMARVERSPKIILRFGRAYAPSGATLSPILELRATEAIFIRANVLFLLAGHFFDILFYYILLMDIRYGKARLLRSIRC